MTFAAPAGRRRLRRVGRVGRRQRRDRRPVGQRHRPDAGAVYLYDGVPTDDGVSRPTPTAQLIHVFTDPNPAPGDEFGASLAEVGTDLLVGAPGQLSGGTGAVYVFDANPDEPDLRRPAGDLHDARPGCRAGAQFGAAVARPTRPS